MRITPRAEEEAESSTTRLFGKVTNSIKQINKGTPPQWISPKSHAEDNIEGAKRTTVFPKVSHRRKQGKIDRTTKVDYIAHDPDEDLGSTVLPPSRWYPSPLPHKRISDTSRGTADFNNDGLQNLQPITYLTKSSLHDTDLTTTTRPYQHRTTSEAFRRHLFDRIHRVKSHRRDKLIGKQVIQPTSLMESVEENYVKMSTELAPVYRTRPTLSEEKGAHLVAHSTLEPTDGPMIENPTGLTFNTDDSRKSGNLWKHVTHYSRF